MYAITLWQPYAQLIADGVKHYATRSWKPPWHLLGKRIAIHAAKRKITTDPYPFGLPSDVFHEMDKHYGWMWWNILPYGAVVATAELVGFFHVEDYADKEQKKVIGTWTDPYVLRQRETLDADPFGDYSPGRYAWWLQSVTKLDEPVPAQGRQRLWKCDVISESEFTKRGLATMQDLLAKYPPTRTGSHGLREVGRGGTMLTQYHSFNEHFAYLANQQGEVFFLAKEEIHRNNCILFIERVRHAILEGDADHTILIMEEPAHRWDDIPRTVAIVIDQEIDTHKPTHQIHAFVVPPRIYKNLLPEEGDRCHGAFRLICKRLMFAERCMPFV